ncbi:MAG: DUF1570 domain-containing protein [Planctomycetaceae bacterium]|nr:DUF1570 domain-containing protein [Planctomycetaceae bacterium]
MNFLRTADVDRRRVVALTSLLCLAVLVNSAAAQVAPRSVRSEATQAETFNVQFKHPQLGPTVARFLGSNGNEAAVIGGDNQIQLLKPADLVHTDRTFAFLDKKQLIDVLKAEFPGFQVRNTNRFVYVYNTSEKFYIGTSRILETMYAPLFDYFKRMKIEVHDPDTLLVVLMFATDDQFQKYRRMPSGVVAYYNMLDNRVTMYEHSRLSQVAPEIAMREAISTVAHEGVHQVLANIGVQQRLSPWPIWISEGLAEYFAPTQVTSDVRWMGVGKVNDLRLGSLNRVMYAASGELEAITKGIRGTQAARVGPQKVENEVDKVIEALAGAEGLSATGYACTWGLTHYLAESRKKEFAAFLVECSSLRPLTTLTQDDRVALFTRHFGDDIDKLGRGLTEHVKRLNARKN